MDFVPADPIILGHEVADSPSAQWYILARRANDAFITVDLAPERAGRCYDSAWDRHAIAGNCPVVALSVRELLERFVARGNGAPWWREPGWEKLGDALD
jgi:hypothetical protein